jgi:membrane protease YdiL (CAAX protease family)
MRSRLYRTFAIARAALVGIFIALFGQGVWAALIGLDLQTTPSIPWAVFAMAPLLWLVWKYLGGSGPPRSTAQARRRYLRANRVPRHVLVVALVAGAASIVALAGSWIVMAQIVRMPSNVLPDMEKYPWLTTVAIITMGSILGPMLEQAGIWGYCQGMLEREFSGPTAALIAALVFAILPHPPMHSALWPRLVFYFLSGATFAAMAYLVNSILPGIVIHIFGDLMFFSLVWPHDGARPLLALVSPDLWFWVHVVQVIVFTMIAIIAFVRLSRIRERAT